GVVYLCTAKMFASFSFSLPASPNTLFAHGKGFANPVFPPPCPRLFLRQARKLTHCLVEHDRDDPAMRESPATCIVRTENKPAAGAPVVEIQYEGQLHSCIIRAAATEAAVRILRIKFKNLPHFTSSA